MLFGAIAGISIVLALFALYFGARTLARFNWIFGWLRGMAGIALLTLAVLLVLIGLDLLSYKQILSEKPLVTVSFERLGEQHFKATMLQIEEGEEESFEILGDQWQVDARIIRWLGFMQTFGAKPGYRLDRISGRYYSLEDERRKTRSVHALTHSEYGLDTWALLKDNAFLPVVDATYGSATYLPMEDGAIFEVSLSASGLTAKPLNPIAEQAISQWQ